MKLSRKFQRLWSAPRRRRSPRSKAQSYMVRRDGKLACVNIRCRKPFEIMLLQSPVFLFE